MRHRRKIAQLALPADQRKALIRSLATSLFTHDEITTTLVRAKALKREADRIVTLAKRGDVHAMRQVSKLIFHSIIPDADGKEILHKGRKVKVRVIEEEFNGKKREIPETVLRRIFRTVAPRFKERQGGYVRVLQAPPRRGDASPMALVQLVD